MPASKYTQEIADKITSLVATTSKSMRTICKEVKVPYGTHLQWLRDKEDYSSQYARAKEDQSDLLIEEMIEIADDSSGDSKVTENGEVINSEYVQRSKIRIDTRKWIASKLKPKKYGDKVDVTTDGDKISNVINLGEGKKPE
jgi:hypothetical protein